MAHEFFPHYFSSTHSDGNAVLEYFCNDSLPYLNDFELINVRVKPNSYCAQSVPLSHLIKGVEFWSNGKLIDSVTTDLSQYSTLVGKSTSNNANISFGQYLEAGTKVYSSNGSATGTVAVVSTDLRDATANYTQSLPDGIISLSQAVPALRALEVLAPPDFAKIQFRIFLRAAKDVFLSTVGIQDSVDFEFTEMPRLAVTSLVDASIMQSGMRLKPTNYIYPLRDTLVIPRQGLYHSDGYIAPHVPSKNQEFSFDLKSVSKRFVRNLIFYPTYTEFFSKQVAATGFSSEIQNKNVFMDGKETPIPFSKLTFSIWINGFPLLNENKVVNPELMANINIMSIGDFTSATTGVELPNSFVNTMARSSPDSLNPCTTGNVIAIRVDGPVHTCRVVISRNCEQNAADFQSGILEFVSTEMSGDDASGHIITTNYQRTPAGEANTLNTWSNCKIKLNVWAEENKRLVSMGDSFVQNTTIHV